MLRRRRVITKTSWAFKHESNVLQVAEISIFCRNNLHLPGKLGCFTFLKAPLLRTAKTAKRESLGFIAVL